MSLTDDRIVRDPAILNGKPTIRGTRISVAHVISLLVAGWTPAVILEEHPALTEADVIACLAYTDRAL
jgi:uncharacterized protein (DUF433 family)